MSSTQHDSSRDYEGFHLMDSSAFPRRNELVDNSIASNSNEPWEHLMNGEDERDSGQGTYGDSEPTKAAAEETTAAVQNLPPRRPRHQIRLTDRLGKRATLVLLLTPLLIVGTLGFIAFLWFGNHESSTWHRFMVKSWITRAVSISSLVLRLSVSLHAGIGVAMLAALALEHYGAFFEHAAAVAVMRSGEVTPQTLFTETVIGWGSPKNLNWVYSILALLLFSTATLLQLTSTALLSDLQLGPLPGLASSSPLSYDFAYNMTALAEGKSFIPAIRRETPWARNPQFYPTFAEYSSPEPPQNNVDDTGVLLRAFLPTSNSQQRQTIRNYTGKALVLDSRVACQPPKLTDLELSWDPSSGSICAVSGSYANSTASNGVLASENPVPFNCPSYFYSNGYTVCQLQSSGNVTGNPAGAFLSSFADNVDSDTPPSLSSMRNFGAPYLVFNSTINVTSVTQDEEPPLTIKQANTSTLDGGSRPWSHWQIPTDNLGDSNGPVPLADFNFTLCYTAFDAARLMVNLYSDIPRTEPLPQFQPSAQSYTFEDILIQLGTNGSKVGARDRGILQMQERPSWEPYPEDALPGGVQPWLQGYSDMQSVSITPGKLIDRYTTGNQTSVLDTANLWYTTEGLTNADPSLVSLFTETMVKNQSIAAAMSSLITVLTSMAYYDQSAQFQTSDQITQVYFETVLYPQGHRGFVAVVLVICLQLVLVAVIAIMFKRLTRFSMIGNMWQSVAQVVSPLTEDFLKNNSLSTQANVTARLKREGILRERVKIAPLQDGNDDRCGLVPSGLTKRITSNNIPLE